MFDKLKTALVLVVIGGLSGLIIYGINELTEDVIAENRLEQERSYYREIFELSSDAEILYDEENPEGELLEIFDIENNLIGFIFKGVEKNNYGEVTVLVGIYADGTIAKVVISSTTNTPNYVKKITRDYIDNFTAQDIDDFDIDAKTGASYTYSSLVSAIKKASILFLESEGMN